MGDAPQLGDQIAMPAWSSPHDDTSSVATQLLEWQATADEASLERLWRAVSPAVNRMIAATLHRLGIHDPSAIDDAVSSVLDHLRRLPAASPDDREVARFAPRNVSCQACGVADQGVAFIVWLSRERAADVARSRHRRASRTTVFSLLDRQTTGSLRACTATDEGESSKADLCLRLQRAIARLPPRERLVIDMVLEGKRQAVIAHVLDVSEGTVSRLRMRAIESLRDLLAE